ncbi:MAG: hypothetical protein KF716_00230 [Anaerolineae bacterium]|nr:hypothetical protein [Anaerolineae bacterium]
MNSITIPIIIDEHRRVVIDIPDDVPLGAAEITITPVVPPTDKAPLTWEAARAKLLAGGALSIHQYELPEGAVRLTDEEIQELTKDVILPKSLDEMIDEDRGPR